ncbi:ABC transporter ATP-binding protein [Candidatus Thorarchaeota archaeon]|nr:MAG: ABC transporter ATP-binding protein [Candidatus Thorarchaeota archaeon]
MLEARDVSFSYERGSPVLRQVSIAIDRGEIVLLTGSTGSGKSTLARCLTGFIPHVIDGSFSGHVAVDGTSLDSMRINEIARKVALVQQDPEGQLCTLRVSDEVAFGPENFLIPEDELAQRVTNSLKAVERPDLMDRATYQLSGGEKQRVAIASMLASGPDYLILDEPTSSLDPSGTHRIRDVLSNLKSQGMGILCIEHRFDKLRSVADRVLQLADDSIVPFTPPPEGSRSGDRSSIEPDSRPLVRAESIGFSYGPRQAVQDITIEVDRGEIVALMGDNGSGKTTLLLLLAGLLSPDSGRVYLDSQAVERLPKTAVARKTAVVFQNPNHQIFESTVWKEQTLGIDVFGLEEETALERANEYLELAELADTRNRNPFSLSHGQKRRLNISSIMVHEPELLLFDEPFIGQDVHGREFVQSVILSAISRGGSALIVTHDSQFTVQFCDRLLFMDNGRILLDGTPSQVMGRLRELGRNEYVNGVGDV